jgi:hypothetical protein
VTRKEYYRYCLKSGRCANCSRVTTNRGALCDSCKEGHQRAVRRSLAKKPYDEKLATWLRWDARVAAKHARKHAQLYADILARARKPTRTIPAEAYRAYNVLVNQVLSAAGLPDGLDIPVDPGAGGECLEWFGPFLSQAEESALGIS